MLFSPLATSSSELAAWGEGLNVAGVVAVVGVVLELGASRVALMSEDTLLDERLVYRAEGGADVLEFVVHVVSDFRQSDDHRQDSDGRHEDEFG